MAFISVIGLLLFIYLIGNLQVTNAECLIIINNFISNVIVHWLLTFYIFFDGIDIYAVGRR